MYRWTIIMAVTLIACEPGDTLDPPDDTGTPIVDLTCPWEGNYRLVGAWCADRVLPPYMRGDLTIAEHPDGGCAVEALWTQGEDVYATRWHWIPPLDEGYVDTLSDLGQTETLVYGTLTLVTRGPVLDHYAQGSGVDCYSHPTMEWR